VPRVHEEGRATAGLLPRLEGRVVAQIGGDVDVGSGGPYGVEQVVAGTTHDGNPAHGGSGRSGHAQPTRRARQGLVQGVRELPQ